MSELQRLAAPLVAEPLAPPPSIAALRARNRRRHRRRLLASSGTALVIVAVVATAVLGTGSAPPAVPSGGLAAYIEAGVSVPPSVLTAVGLPSGVDPPTAITGPALSDAGKPAVVYVGAEFCPYCALERWALVVALSRFGTFADLGQAISSSANDVYPNLKSWSFHGSTYSSPYLTFDPAEIASDTATGVGSYQPLDTLSALQAEAFHAHDSGGGIPFLDVGGRYVVLGASASPAVLEGLTLDQVATDLNDPSSPVAQAVDGTANYLIAAMCSVTGAALPACSASTVAAAVARMKV